MLKRIFKRKEKRFLGASLYMKLKGNSVLIIDKNPNNLRSLVNVLRNNYSSVLFASNSHSALRILKNKKIELLIATLAFPESSGVSFLINYCNKFLNIPILDIGFFREFIAPTLCSNHQCDQNTLNFNNQDSTLSLHRFAGDTPDMPLTQPDMPNASPDQWGEFVGKSPEMRNVYKLIQKIATSDANVFVTGETGTGKELVARAVHKHSRRSGLFIAVNCAAIPADLLESELFGHVRGAFSGAHKDRIGKFMLADKGTLFLDEITEMRMDLQAKLLRILQEKKIERLGCNLTLSPNVRIITSSNRDSEAAIEAGLLRQDLYFRINVVNIDIPSLRERREDIPLLALSFIKKFAQGKFMNYLHLIDELNNKLVTYNWPGNVRELENLIERAVVLNQGINYAKAAKDREGRRSTDYISRQTGRRKTDLKSGALEKKELAPASLEISDEDISLESNVAKIEITLLTRALAMANGNKSKAAHLLKTSERILNYKLKKYGLNYVSPA